MFSPASSDERQQTIPGSESANSINPSVRLLMCTIKNAQTTNAEQTLPFIIGVVSSLTFMVIVGVVEVLLMYNDKEHLTRIYYDI